jgi:hypothetical protein
VLGDRRLYKWRLYLVVSDSLIDFTHAQRLQALMPQAANTVLIKINGGTHLNLQEILAYGQALAAGLSKL